MHCIRTWKTFSARSVDGFEDSSFQACERVRHLGCVFAQAVASRYDKFFFILFVFGELNCGAHKAFVIKGASMEDGNAVTLGTLSYRIF